MPGKSTFFRLAVIGALTLAVYGESLFSSFHFDDRSTILENPSFRNRTQVLPSLWRFWPTRFLTSLTLYCNWRLGGTNPFGYHLFNLIVHAANAIVLYFLLAGSLRRAGAAPRAESAAWLGGLLFALHPLQTQAVTYVSQRATCLSACLYLSGLLLYSRGGEKSHPARWWGVGLLGAGAMLAKEFAVTFPLALILWDAVFVGRRNRPKFSRYLLFGALLFLVPLLVYLNRENPKYNDSGQIAFWTGSRNFEEVAGGIRALDRWSYAATQLRVMAAYLRLIVLPVRQNLDYDHPLFFSLLQPQITLPAIVLLSLLLMGLAMIRGKKRMGGFGMFFFFLALMPESSLIPIRDVIFEHRLYLPMAGAAFLLAEAAITLKRGRSLLPLLVFCFALLAFSRNRVWKDEITLWVDTAAKSPGKARPSNNLGYIYNQKGLYAEAAGCLTRAIAIEPAYAEAMVNLAISYRHLERLGEAETLCRKALKIKPRYPEGYNCLGDLLRLKGDLAGAERSYREALRIKPDFPEVMNNLANLYQEMGQPELAARHYRAALERKGESAEFLNNLGLLELNSGKTEEAIATFRRALELDPSLHQGHYNLGNALLQAGKTREAIAAYSRAIELKPDYSRAYFNRGVAGTQLEDWDRALNDFLKVTELEPNSAPAHLKAGVIFAVYRGDAGRARHHLSRALALDPRLPERATVERLLKQLEVPSPETQ